MSVRESLPMGDESFSEIFSRALRDVDTVADADAVAALAPGSRFAAAWATARERSFA